MLSIDYLLSRQEKPTADQNSDRNSSKIIEESNSLCILSAILKNSDQIIFWLTTTFSDEADGREICSVGKSVIQLYLRFSQQIRNAWIEIVLTVEA